MVSKIFFRSINTPIVIKLLSKLSVIIYLQKVTSVQEKWNDFYEKRIGFGM